MKPQYETSFWRLALAILSGSISGGVLLMITAILGDEFPEGLDDIEYFLTVLLFVLGGAFYWLIGIAIFGSIPWLVLHKFGFRNLRAFMVVGALVPLTIWAIFQILSVAFGEGAANFVDIIRIFAFIGVMGAIIGGVIWRVAYCSVDEVIGGE